MMKTFATALVGGLRSLAASVPSLTIDLAGLCGVGLIGYGAWLIYPPAGFITAGILLALGAIVLGARLARRAG